MTRIQIVTGVLVTLLLLAFAEDAQAQRSRRAARRGGDLPIYVEPELCPCELTPQLEPQVAPAQNHVVYLEQGLSDAERQRYYFTPQGSELIPYRWFVALEQPFNSQLFRADDHIKSLGYLTGAANEHNPDGLPIGFVRERAADGRDWFGLTCAACHTGQISYRGTDVRVDGGTTLADIIKFEQTLVASLQATDADEAKFQRFAARVLGGQTSAPTVAKLRADLKMQTESVAALVARNRPAHPSGPARWDAVNVLINEMDGTALDAPENYRTPQVPVSYPSIWLTDELDWVLWNGAVHRILARSVGEVIVVFGHAKLGGTPTEPKFESSVKMKELYSTYETLEKLAAPRWPDNVLGAIDQERARRGAQIYQREKCAQCHADKPPYPMTEPNQYGHSFIKTNRTPLAEVGTDPTYALYFVQRTASPAKAAPLFKGTMFEGQPNMPAAVLFLGVLFSLTDAELDALHLTPEQRLMYEGSRAFEGPPTTPEALGKLVESLLVYKTQPLAGIWSTAPYLHNGSVPNLYQLLLPPDQRLKSFYLGNREFDPKNVGYQAGPFPGGFEVRTDVPGNSNAGHSYGTQITDDERWDLVEYLKTL